MLLMRRSEDADGESRMMGSMRRPGFVRLATSEVLGVIAEGVALEAVVFAGGLAPVGSGALGRLRLMNGSVSLWMCEKSYVGLLVARYASQATQIASG